jgi:hypothetical protein
MYWQSVEWKGIKPEFKSEEKAIMASIGDVRMIGNE